MTNARAPARSRSISLAALTVLELRPADMISCAADAGYTHVGLRLIPATAEEADHKIVGNVAMIAEMVARLAATGIEVLDIEIFRLRPDTRVADYAAALEIGARLGAKHVLVAGNDPDESRLVDRFGAFCDLSKPLGLTADLEPMPWTDVKNVTQAARVVTAADRPNGGIVVDAIHFDRSASSVADIAAIPAMRFNYMQLCDAPAERPRDDAELLRQARSDRLVPGEGGLDLHALLRALPCQIPIGIEVPNLEWAKAVGATERARALLAATRSLLLDIEQGSAL